MTITVARQASGLPVGLKLVFVLVLAAGVTGWLEPRLFREPVAVIGGLLQRVKLDLGITEVPDLHGDIMAIERGADAVLVHHGYFWRGEQATIVGMRRRRIGKLPGSKYFDDRSTAFGVSSLAFSRAISDVALMLRYIWITAGGVDQRKTPAESEGRLLVVRGREMTPEATTRLGLPPG